ncbi:MAG: LLM class flavin-dependent oxidoreductase [Actinomycetota bacterium]
MTVQLGAHIGQQNLSMGELRALWRRLDDDGLDWLSLWDHLYEAPPAGGTIDHFEPVAALGAMAIETVNARLGCLVFYVGYRNAGVLAKAAITLDHLSEGRFELGLGGGWHQPEAVAYGYDFPRAGIRLDHLEEAAAVIGEMLTPAAAGPGTHSRIDADGIRRTSFDGEHVRLVDASCLPQPAGRLPLWIGGRGEKRTLRTVARYADGWNAAYVSAEEFGRLNGVLDDWCVAEGRDRSDIERSVNLSFALGRNAERAEAIRAEGFRAWGARAEAIMAGTLLGTPDDAFDAVMAYVANGAQLVNVALRAPFDERALRVYVEEVVPAVRAATEAGSGSS